MTTRPTIAANKAVNATLGAAEWNTNCLQQGNWTQEVLLGTNADKIPGTALSSALVLPGTLSLSSQLACSANGAAPATGGFGLVVGNNRTAGAGETNFYNIFNGGAGFEWLQANGGGTLVAVLAVDGTGKLTGAGILRTSNTQITNGSTITVAHNFGTSASVIDGNYGTASNTFTLAIGHAAADTVRFSGARINAFDVTNTSGASVWVNTFCMR